MNPQTWLEEHGDALYRYALLRVHHETEAEDLVQETFLAALKNRQNFSQQSATRTWLIGILKHKIIDLTRRQFRELPLDENESTTDDLLDDFFNEKGHWISPPTAWQCPEKSLENTHFWQILHHCIQYLPPKFAYLFTLKELNDVNNEKICKELELSTTNLWVMLFRTRLQLRQCLEIHWLGQKEVS